MTFGTPITISRTPTSSSASAASSAATLANIDHDYNVPETHDGNQDADHKSSDPDTPVKPKFKRQKAELSLADLQDNIIATVSVCADNLGGMITKNTVSIEALKKIH